MMLCLRALIVLVCTLAWTSGSAEVRRFALVVGENQPNSEELPTLQFADDDAVGYARVLRLMGAEVEMLTVLDTDSQRRVPEIAGMTLPPTLDNVLAAAERLNQKIIKARAEGHSTEFFFAFAGHGERAADGSGFLHLRGGILTRRILLERLGGG